MSQGLTDSHLKEWNEDIFLAEAAVPLIGRLLRESNVIIIMYGRPLFEKTPIGILREHRWVRKFEKNTLSIRDSFPLLEQLMKMELRPCRIDLGKLAVEWIGEDRSPEPAAFLQRKLQGMEELSEQVLEKPQDVVLYGFGRIGRLVARLLIERAGSGDVLRLRAIVVRRGSDDDLYKRASLLRRDSVHGRFAGSIQVDTENDALIANGHFIKVIYSNAPDEVDYTEYGIQDAIVIDNTGKWRDREGLGKHLEAKGACKALLTAPGKGDIKNVVFGVNDDAISEDENIVSAASCTTNAITPVLRAVLDGFGITSGHVETVHSYTNDQNLIDNYHPKTRRGRAAGLNMVITETGAAKAVSKAIPELEGKLTGNAIRVPTPNVSMAILNLALERETTAKELNEYLRGMALHSDLASQIDYTQSTEVSSTDIVGSRFPGVVDSAATIVNGNHCVLYVWYDNEFGYSMQVIRVVQKMAGVEFATLPKK
ncbi:MAG: glyceraldehyde 3-phosphate dehydrogenase [Planctomycetota bacterium]|jgi:glyceraldehyde 3-phosphate dehydrogenase